MTANVDGEAYPRAAGRRRQPMSPGLRLGLIGVGIFLAVGILSRFWLPGGLDLIIMVDVASKLHPPLSAGHLLGTDYLGRDMAAQIMRATSNTLVIVVAGTAIAVSMGVSVGLLAAMFRGFPEQVLMRVVDVVYAVPAVLLALVLAAKLGASVGTTVVALGLWFFPVIARVTRSAALTVRERAFIKAARSYGRSNWFIAWRHVLPNIISIVLVQVTLVLALGILVEASLAFLGVGTQPPEPSWGRMLKESQHYFSVAPWLAIVPGLTIMLAVLSFNLLGNGLRDRLDRRSQPGPIE